MEGIELDSGAGAVGDFGDSILARFGDSAREEDQCLCTVVGAMSQELKDQGVASSPVAFFGATWSSLERVLSEPEPPSHAVEALVTLLSLLLPRVSAAVLRKKADSASALVVRVLQSPSSSAIGAASSGLKCASYLVTVRDAKSWSEVCQLYGILLGFVTDSRPKVRRQAHLCLRNVMQKFQKTSLVAPASEGLTNLFKRFLLLAGGSKGNSDEGPKGAQEVLHILDALKECLPLMSQNYTTIVLKHYITLIDLHQPIVTRRVTDSLLLLCIKPGDGVSAEALLDILCSLAISASTNETSVDALTFTARLLDVGMLKVYHLNRQLCVVKLPVVLNALRDILASDHEEPMHSAVNTFKSLIHSCIDDTMIKQGVDEIIKMNISTEDRKSGPTMIEKICATIESLLGYNYTSVLDLSFQVISSMFDKLGVNSSYLLRVTLKSLADMQMLPDEDFPFRKQLHECLGSALVAMGPQTFMGLLPLNLDAEDLSEVNTWLFPILKQYTIGAHMSFFVEILDMIRQMKNRSKKLELQGRVHSSRGVDGLVYSLWSLLTSFCNFPLDVAESLKDLEKDLCSGLNEEDFCGIICSSLQILVQQNKKILEKKNDISDLDNTEASVSRGRIMAYYTPQVAEENLSALGKSARVLLPALSKVFLSSTKDDGGSVQSAIGELASISEKKVVSRLFMNTMSKLLMVTKEAGEARNSKKSAMSIDEPSSESSPSVRRGHLLDLAGSFLPGLSSEEIKVLYTAIKPALQDDEGLIQKKAYKVLSLILENGDMFFSTQPEILHNQLSELLELMIEALPSCQFSAKRHRLDCLHFLIVSVLKANIDIKQNDITSSFLTEIILALKETNSKTRDRAYDILVEIGHAYGDEEKGGKTENLRHYFTMVAGGLAGETPHMISAAVKGVARLAYEFSDLLSSAWNLLPSSFLLLRRNNKEIIKANLGLLKVVVAKSKAEGLQLHLGSMVEGLLMWQDTKSPFKSKSRVLLDMLMKKCGDDAVRAVMPETHMKLFNNIRKVNERKKRKLDEAKSQVSRATTSRLSRWNHSKIFSQFGDEETENSDEDYMDSRTASRLKSKASTLRAKTRMGKNTTGHSFNQEDEDEPLDLLDRQKTRSALKSGNLKRKQASEEEPEFDAEGRLIISEDGELKVKRDMSDDSDDDTKSKTASQFSKSSRKTQKRQKTGKAGWAYTGGEYVNKKASGDMTRKDKLEPYAFWPLDRKMMSRRSEHRETAKKGMASVVRMTRKLEGKSASTLLSSGSLKIKKKGHKKTGKKKVR